MRASEPPAPFETGPIEAVADEFDVAPNRLAELVASHQALVDRLPGAENLVYEWRKQFGATVLARSQAWYLVAAPAWVWEEFADDLDATDAELDALATVHEQTVRNHPDVTTDGIEDSAPIVLRRQ